MIKKAFYLGLGAACLTREKAEKIYSDLVEKGEMNHNEARSFIDEAVKKGIEQQNEIKKMVKEEIDKVLGELPFVTRKEYEEKINELENQLKQK